MSCRASRRGWLVCGGVSGGVVTRTVAMRSSLLQRRPLVRPIHTTHTMPSGSGIHSPLSDPRLALHVVAPRTSAWHIPWHPGLGARGVGARGPDRVPQPLPGPRRGAQGRSVPIRSIDDTRSAIAITSCESCEERAGPRAAIRPRLSPRQRRQRRAVSWWLLRLAILIVYATHATHSLSSFRLTTS